MDHHKISVDEDMQYAIFVSYVEIYNNYTYDLLATPKMDIVTGKQKLASKILREDSLVLWIVFHLVHQRSQRRDCKVDETLIV